MTSNEIDSKKKDSTHLPKDELLEETARDSAYVELIQHFNTGFQSKSEQISPPIRNFWKLGNDLCNDDGKFSYGTRIIISFAKTKEK